uniref:Uncharacterized protein n=1 Tax=Arundo donax TaxID=35708 RepID=A0A0A9B0K1_ARUDO
MLIDHSVSLILFLFYPSHLLICPEAAMLTAFLNCNLISQHMSTAI